MKLSRVDGVEVDATVSIRSASNRCASARPRFRPNAIEPRKFDAH